MKTIREIILENKGRKLHEFLTAEMWTHCGWGAILPSGKPTNSLDEDACKMCLGYWVAMMDGRQETLRIRVLEECNRRSTEGHKVFIHQWNDKPERKFEEVLDVLRTLDL